MKNEDLQKVVFSKYENGDHSTKIFHDLNGVLGLRTNHKPTLVQNDLRDWVVDGRSRTIRTEGTIKKIKNQVKQTK